MRRTVEYYVYILASRPGGAIYVGVLQREKNMKHWPRAWKTRLVARENPSWRDLYEEIAAGGA